MIPDTIYLQWYGDDGEEQNEKTWCVDQIYDTDIVYTRQPVTWEPVPNGEIPCLNASVLEVHGEWINIYAELGNTVCSAKPEPNYRLCRRVG